MNKEFFEALKLLEVEKGIPADYLLEKIKAAISIAVRRDYGQNSVINMEFNPEKAKFKVSLIKDVVEVVEDPDKQITLEEAKEYKKSYKLGASVP